TKAAVETTQPKEVVFTEKPTVIAATEPKVAVETTEPIEVAFTEKPIVITATEPKVAVGTTQPVEMFALNYYIQVVSLSKYAPSEKFLDSITALGYTYKLHEVTNDSKTTTKVLVGPFPNATKAKDARIILRAKIEPGSFLVKL
ncbi:SPOR domain-containing protein, partial [Sulfurimonas sp.]|uniref:SPOR domain-containing protein n=1 Tax=Sulfurimonas sp. TaxID=2022749 RepID=UPI0025F08059